MTDQATDAAASPSPPKKKSDLGPRLLTSVIAVPLLLWLLLAGPPWAFALLIGAAVFIAAWEYMSIVTGGQQRVVQVVTCLGATAVGATMYLASSPGVAPDGHMLMAVTTGAALAIFIAALFTYRQIEEVTLLLGSGGMALIYCGAMPAMLALIFRDGGADGKWWVLMAMAVIWGSDTGAYFSGRAFGKHKLAPRVSPKKTIEGAVGGLLTSIAVVVIFKLTALPELAWWQVFALSIPANFLGQVGDLCESLLKRAHGVKDSGVIIYGHGGLLDRIDALMFAAPWFYVFQRYLA